MGFEYKIILEGPTPEFLDKPDQLITDLTSPESSSGTWPDYFLSRKNNEIYICKNVERALWKGLERLQTLLYEMGNAFVIEDL